MRVIHSEACERFRPTFCRVVWRAVARPRPGPAARRAAANGGGVAVMPQSQPIALCPLVTKAAGADRGRECLSGQVGGQLWVAAATDEVADNDRFVAHVERRER